MYISSMSDNLNVLKKFEKYLNGTSIVNSSCNFDVQNPFDKSILEYIKMEDPIDCGEEKFDKIISIEGNQVKIIPSKLEDHLCYGRNFEFKSGGKDDDNKYHEWISFDNNGFYNMTTDFANILCYKKSLFNIKIKVYEKTISTILPQNILEYEKEEEDDVSVIMIGIDSMSRSNFIRSLPKTYKFLQNNDFIDFKRHVKVADNTYGNWIAILTGLRASWSKDMPMEITDEWNIWFDDIPVIWKNFTSKGYVTFFAEDRSDIATFNFKGKLNGFKKQPTTHYFRNYWIDVERSILYKQSKFGCYGGTSNTETQLDYLTDFLDKYQNIKKFAWWWSTEMSHDNLNTISSMDTIYHNFLVNNYKKMKDSIVIFFSDHGNRYDNIRETNVGRFETRLPFLNIHLPKKLKELYPFLIKIMIENSNKMTTQYDLHETLKSILKKEWKKDFTKRRGYSLFHKHPHQRECITSGIPENYCPCNKEVDISLKESHEAATFLVDYLNIKLTNFNNFVKSNIKYKCKLFEIDKILYSSLTIPSDVITKDVHLGRHIISNHLSIVYRLMIRMKAPSRALIEALVEQNLSTGKFIVKEEIERNNK
uniref:Sulfatase domain-containing protein n=1 Tax=Parastrongyloides trichosuri TaxID=131310 RepID=A0A0N4Z0Y6_PARTI